MRCSYPEPYKRGFPEGYLSGLEQRLIQTELALFQVLMTHTVPGSSPIARQSAEPFKNHASSISKGKRMEEWQSLPLDTEQDRLTWWRRRAQELGLGDLSTTSVLLDRQNLQSEPQGLGSVAQNRTHEDIADDDTNLLSPQQQWSEDPLQHSRVGSSTTQIDPPAYGGGVGQLSQIPPPQIGEGPSLASMLARSHTRKFF